VFTSGTCVANPVATGTVVVSTLKQTVNYAATFTIPPTGLPTPGATTGATADFNAAFVGYGIAIGAGLFASNTWTPAAGFTLVAGNSRRAGTPVVFTVTATTCTSGCNTAIIYADPTKVQNTLLLTQSTTLAAQIMTYAVVVSGQSAPMASPTVSPPVVQGGDSGKTAVVAVTAFATAVIAMVM